MRSILSLIAVGVCLVTALSASEVVPPILFEEPLSPRIANYDIEVRLEPARRMIHGSELLTWINKSPVPIEELRFHLYLNGFRNTRSTFIEESGGRMRGADLDENGWGFIEVDRIELVGPEAMGTLALDRYVSSLPGMMPLPAVSDASGAAEPTHDLGPLGGFPLNRQPFDLTSGMEFLQPDDGNLRDRTVFRVALPEPLPPGEAVALDIDFHAQLPTPPFARTGAKEEYFFVGQWFPKIAVHTGEEWYCHQFHYNSEFFADFGVYDVAITVPTDHVVGATGQEFERIDHGDGTSTHRYYAEDVHDFAWTSSPDYVEFETETSDGDVAVRVLMQRDNLDLAQLHLDATVRTIEFFQATWGDYPFPNFTVVDPRRGAGGSGGMEYPTIVTAGTTRGGGLLPGVTELLIESVIVHEFGHNYWYHLLASNEAEESWLDEGINTYTDGRVAAEVFPDRRLLGLDLDLSAFDRFFLASSIKDPVKTTSWKMATRGSYRSNSYSRPGAILGTLRGYLGPERMQEVMRTYVERWRFRHPTTEDFVAVVEDVAAEDLGWFFDQALYGTEELDYAVTEIENRKLEDRGYDLTRSVEEPWNGQGEFAGPEVDEASESPEEEPTRYRNRVLVQRLGGFRFPVRLQVTFDDGTVAEEVWDGEGRWRRFEWEGNSKIVEATVDPERLITLDRDYLNNGLTAGPASELGVDRLSASARLFAQLVLDLFSL